MELKEKLESAMKSAPILQKVIKVSIHIIKFFICMHTVYKSYNSDIFILLLIHGFQPARKN